MRINLLGKRFYEKKNSNPQNYEKNLKLDENKNS